MVRTRCTGGGGPRVEAASIPPLVLEPFQVLRGRAADRHRGHAELAMVPRSNALDVDAHRDALVEHDLDERLHLFGIRAGVALEDVDADTGALDGHAAQRVVGEAGFDRARDAWAAPRSSGLLWATRSREGCPP